MAINVMYDPRYGYASSGGTSAEQAAAKSTSDQYMAQWNRGTQAALAGQPSQPMASYQEAMSGGPSSIPTPIPAQGGGYRMNAPTNWMPDYGEQPAMPEPKRVRQMLREERPDGFKDMVDYTAALERATIESMKNLGLSMSDPRGQQYFEMTVAKGKAAAADFIVPINKDEWQKIKDQRGNEYYLNLRTGETQGQPQQRGAPQQQQDSPYMQNLMAPPQPGGIPAGEAGTPQRPMWGGDRPQDAAQQQPRSIDDDIAKVNAQLQMAIDAGDEKGQSAASLTLARLEKMKNDQEVRSKALSPNQENAAQSMADMIVEYKRPWPTGMEAKNPVVQRAQELARNMDPTYDAKEYVARQAFKRDFAAGKSGVNKVALNTAIKHLNTLNDAAEKLSNFDWGAIAANPVKNWLSKNLTGDARVDRFNAALDALAGELAKAFAGKAGTDQEIEAIRKTISTSSSHQQLKGVVNQYMDLMAGRLGAAADQYKTVMKDDKDFGFIDPKNRTILKTLGAADPDLYDPIKAKDAAQAGGTSFATEDEAQAAQDAGKIKRGDKITIGGRTATVN